MQELISPIEVAEMYGVTRQYVTKLLAEKKIAGIQISGNWIIKRASLQDSYLENRKKRKNEKFKK